ncbi:MAG TPA: ABC transporter permease, partial [Longimicrobiales bacterium]|nr:ABC transporter permease [Longimicrobiales bacterium]
PALQAMRINLAHLLAGQGRGKSGRRHRRVGRWFVGAQVTLSTIGLIVAAYLGWGFLEIGKWTEGLPLDRMAMAAVTLPADRYQQPDEQNALAGTLRRELQQIPGVQLVSIANATPATGGGAAQVKLPGDATDASGRNTSWIAADENLAAAYDLAVLAGRNFNPSDDANAPRVALVTPAFARERLKGEPIGARIQLKGVHDADEWVEVVGVVQDWLPNRSGQGTSRVILPLAQLHAQRFHLAIRTTNDPSLVLPGIRAAVGRIDARLPVEDVRTLNDLMAWLLRVPRVLAGFGVAGGLAGIIVAAIGLYGVISFQVRSRIAELGVRMALGAGTQRILAEVIFDGIARIAPGIGIGLALGLAAAPLLGSLAAAARSAPSVLLLVGVVFTMLLVGVLASLEPALRAARLEPQQVLRAD